MKLIMVVLAVALLGGCVVVPLGPHGGYHEAPYYAPPPHGHPGYGHGAPRYYCPDAPGFGRYERGGYH